MTSETRTICPSRVSGMSSASPSRISPRPLECWWMPSRTSQRQVQPLAVVLELLDDAQALLGMVEPAGEELVQRRFAGVAERRVPEVVRRGRWPRSGPRSGAGPGRWSGRSGRPRGCGSAASGSGPRTGERKTWVLCLRRRKDLEWMIRSRSRWKAVRMECGDSGRFRPRESRLRQALGERIFLFGGFDVLADVHRSSLRPGSAGDYNTDNAI